MSNPEETPSTTPTKEYKYFRQPGPRTPGPDDPLPHELPRFKWDASLRYRALEQNLSMPNLPYMAIYYVRHETKWQPEPFEQEVWTDADMKLVGTGQKECPYCHGDHEVKHEVKRNYFGVDTGLRILRPEPCQSLLFQRFFSRWCNPANVAADYRNVTLDNLESYAENLNGFPVGKKLKYLLKMVRDNQYNCYLLAGPAGTGKSTLMTAMYHRALGNWALESFERDVYCPAVWKITASTLAKQFREWELRDVGRDGEFGEPTLPPEVTVEKIFAAIRAGFVPCLFQKSWTRSSWTATFRRRSSPPSSMQSSRMVVRSLPV